MGLIRRAQAYAVLNKGIKNSQSNTDLNNLYDLSLQTYRTMYPDLTLAQLKQYIPIHEMTLANLLPAERMEAMNRLQSNYAKLEQAVLSRQDKFENEAAAADKKNPTRSSLDKVVLAYQELGLILTARDLLDTPQSREQIALDTTLNLLAQMTLKNLEILLTLGEADTAAVVLSEQFKDRLGTIPGLNIPAYQWFNAVIAASQGRYQVADAFLKECVQAAQQNSNALMSNYRDLTFAFPPKGQFNKITATEMLALNFGRRILAETTVTQGYPALVSMTFDLRLPIDPRMGSPWPEDLRWKQTIELFMLHAGAQAIVSELEICRGFLSLEAGDISAAKQAFIRALEASSFTPSNFIVRKALAKIP